MFFFFEFENEYKENEREEGVWGGWVDGPMWAPSPYL